MEEYFSLSNLLLALPYETYVDIWRKLNLRENEKDYCLLSLQVISTITIIGAAIRELHVF